MVSASAGSLRRPSPARGIRGRARRDDTGRAVLKCGLLAAVLLALSVLPAASATPVPSVWSAGFESGDFSEWGRREAVPGAVTVVRVPVRDGHFASKFTVGPGDVPGASGERAELS